MKVVTFGEIMLRLAPPGFQRFAQARTFEVMYGGGEANVAVSLANYGEVAELVTCLPKNDLGDACLAFLRSYGVRTDHIARGGDRLGIYFLETGAAQRASKVVYDRAGSSFAALEPGMINWKSALEGADWFHWTGITPAVSQGARGMLRVAFDVLPGHGDYEPMREEFLAYYLADLCVDTRLFPGMETVLRTLDARGLAWGIVTNKLHRFTQPLLEKMQLHERAACIVSGDTTARPKPHPDPLLEAARRIDVAPARCLYIGDDERDVQAANAAGMTAVVALWGYLGDENPPDAWGASHLKADPEELLGLL